MSSIAEKMMEIVDKYEVPMEYQDALWAAYELGGERLKELFIQKEIEKITGISNPQKAKDNE